MTDYSKLKKGDRIQIGNRKATLLTKPVFLTTPTSGLYYANVLFDDGELKPKMMICLRNLEVLKEVKK